MRPEISHCIHISKITSKKRIFWFFDKGCDFSITMLPFILRRPSYKISYGHVHRSQAGDASDMPRVASSIHGPAMSDLLHMLPGGAKEDRNDYVSVLIKITCGILWLMFLPVILHIWPLWTAQDSMGRVFPDNFIPSLTFLRVTSVESW